MVNQVADYSIFSTFNLKSAYHQVEIAWKTGFILPLKLMEGCMNLNVSLCVFQMVYRSLSMQ